MAAPQESSRRITPLAPMPPGELYLAGSGSFAAEIADWAGDAGWKVLGLIELLDLERVGGTTDGHLVVGLDPPPGGGRAVVAMGGSRSEHWALVEGHGWTAATVVHPTAHVSSRATLGPGCVVGPQAVIGSGTTIGAHTLASRGALVGHHCQIGAFASLMPGANLGGHARVGDDTVVGMGATIVNGGDVGERATVAAGAVVLGVVADGSRVQGVPAREFQR